jgi:hypothetical protein
MYLKYHEVDCLLCNSILFILVIYFRLMSRLQFLVFNFKGTPLDSVPTPNEENYI